MVRSACTDASGQRADEADRQRLALRRLHVEVDQKAHGVGEELADHQDARGGRDAERAQQHARRPAHDLARDHARRGRRAAPAKRRPAARSRSWAAQPDAWLRPAAAAPRAARRGRADDARREARHHRAERELLASCWKASAGMR